MNKEEIKDILKRAFKTFIQGFLAVLVYSLKDQDLTDLSILKPALIGALAGGISAVMNFTYNLLPKNDDNEYGEEVEEEE